MIAGLYSATSNMDAVLHQQDTIASNIANSGVSGHKSETVVFRSFPDLLSSIPNNFVAGNAANRTAARVGTGVGVDWAYLNFEPGPAVETGVPTDLMIDGDGYFVVDNGRGEERYTRNSEFKIKVDPDGKMGTITTKEGYSLQGENGPIRFPADKKFTIDLTGNVAAGGQRLDKIRMISVPDNNVMLPESGATFKIEKKWWDDIQPAKEAVVRQGYLERSNVNTVLEMARMIESFRNYESAAKVITTLDRTLDQAVNDVGRSAG